MQGQAREPEDKSRAQFRLGQSWRGSFTQPKVDQVALTFYQGFCEPSQWRPGSTIVMQRGATPKIAHHDRAFGPTECVAAVASDVTVMPVLWTALLLCVGLDVDGEMSSVHLSIAALAFTLLAPLRWLLPVLPSQRQLWQH